MFTLSYGTPPSDGWISLLKNRHNIDIFTPEKALIFENVIFNVSEKQIFTSVYYYLL